MAATLIGEVVNSCDSTTGFNAGNVSTDDDYVEGTGAIGAKVSNTTQDFTTTSLGASAPYNFSVGGGQAGYHIVMWFSSKSRLSATTGYEILVSNGTASGRWRVPPVTSELKRNGAFVSRVVSTARNFDAASVWAVGGNPAQLTGVSQMGGALTTAVSIMGNFNNAQIDQITIGMGIRLDGTGNSFETARAADEDTNYWGWSQANVLKGGIYIGPATGSATCTFTSTGETRVFAASAVDAGFFRVEGRGAGTTVTLNSATITAANPATARWDYTVGATTLAWTDTDSVYAGIRNMTLQSAATLTNIKISNAMSIVQNGATLDGVSTSSPNVTSGVALVTSNNPANIKNCTFTAGAAGHAIVITAPGTYSFDGNSFSGYGADGTNNAAVYNNSGGAVTLNIVGGGDTPTVRNGTLASTTINNAVTFTLTNLVAGSRVYVRNDTDSVVLFNQVEPTTTFSESINYTGDKTLTIRVRNASGSPYYKPFTTGGTLTSTGFSAQVNQIEDE